MKWGDDEICIADRTWMVWHSGRWERAALLAGCCPGCYEGMVPFFFSLPAAVREDCSVRFFVL